MVNLSSRSVLYVLLFIAVLLMYAKTKASEAVDKGLSYVDVTSKDNLAAQLSNKTTAALTGGQDKTLGGYWHRKCKEQNYEPWYCPEI